MLSKLFGIGAALTLLWCCPPGLGEGSLFCPTQSPDYYIYLSGNPGAAVVDGAGNVSNNGCPAHPATGNINQVVNASDNASQESSSGSCHYVTVYYPLRTISTVTEQMADLLDAYACIPVFWGNWAQSWAGRWTNFVGDQLDPNQNGMTIYAKWYMHVADPTPVTCDMFATHKFIQIGEAVDYVHEWTCPCPTTGDNCPAGWGGQGSDLAMNQNGMWGTIWAEGPVKAVATDNSTLLGRVTYIWTEGQIPIGPAPYVPGTTPGTPTGGTGTGGTPTGIPPMPPECKHVQVVYCDVLGYLRINYDPQLKLCCPPDSASSRVWTFSSPNGSLYQGLTSGTAIMQGGDGGAWVTFMPDSTQSAPTLAPDPGQSLNSIDPLLVVAGANNGPGLSDPNALLSYGATHYHPDTMPQPKRTSGQITSVPLPGGGPCLKMEYTLPGPCNDLSLTLNGKLCVDIGIPNVQHVHLDWSSTSVKNLYFSSSNPILQELLRSTFGKDAPPSGSFDQDVNLHMDTLAGGQGRLEVTIAGVQIATGASIVASTQLDPGAGKLSVENVTTQIAFTTSTEVTVSWNASMSVAAGAGSPVVDATVYQAGRSLNQWIFSAPTNFTFIQRTDSDGPISLVIRSDCSGYTNTINIPHTEPPDVSVWGLYEPVDGVPAKQPGVYGEHLLDGGVFGTIPNPGTVVYHVVNKDDDPLRWTIHNATNNLVLRTDFVAAKELWITNNAPDTYLEAHTESAAAFSKSTSSPEVKIYLETPVLPDWMTNYVGSSNVVDPVNLVLTTTTNLVLNNRTNVLITNWVQHANAIVAQWINLNSGHPVQPKQVPWLQSYPAIPLNDLPPGVQILPLDGNNVTNNGIGYWTNEFWHTSMSDKWYTYIVDVDPVVVPDPVFVIEGGTNWGVARFDVGQIDVSIDGTSVTAQTITERASLFLVQNINGAWVTNQSTFEVPRTTFHSVDLGYETYILGTREAYNPNITRLGPQVVFTVIPGDCGGAKVIYNHAISTILVTGTNSSLVVTNTYKTPLATNDINTEAGSFTVFGYLAAGGAPLQTNVTIATSQTYQVSSTGGMLGIEPDDPSRYRLWPLTNIVTLQIQASNPNIVLQTLGPWVSTGSTSARLDLSALAQNMELTTTNYVIIDSCRTNLLPIDVIGYPPFDIPVSPPTTNDCILFRETPVLTSP